jgi:TolB-like protein
MQPRTSSFGPFTLDHERRTLRRDGRPLSISSRGYALLELLLEAGGEPVSKQALMDRAWPGTVVEEGNLTVQISALRRELGESGEAMIITVPRVGYRLLQRAGSLRADGVKLPLIAVLPFENHGSIADDGYFADGVVEEIITALSRFRTFAVVARGSTFAQRAKTPNVSALGVDYVLEGSIRRMDKRLRVTARLSDARKGTHLWAERYEGAVADVFSFQDRITESVVGVVEPAIRKAEIQRARRKPAANLDAYDLFLRAVRLFYNPGIEGHAEAIALFERSSELDPGFAPALAYAAWVYERRHSMRLPWLGENDPETCVGLARRALEIGGDDPVIRGICGWVLYRVAKDLSALQGLRQAVEENPNNVVILTLAGSGNCLNGAVDEAYRCNLRAYELSPGAPEAYQSLQGIAAAEMMRGNYESAIDWCRKSLATFNDWFYTYITLATSYAMLDRMDEAREMIRLILEQHPKLTLKIIEDGADDEDQFAWAILPGLRKAGLPAG